jgi:hypothetical protein
MLKSDFADNAGQQMMTRLWPASLALALIFGAGQAFADHTCQPFTTVTIDPGTGIISVTGCQSKTTSSTGFFVNLINAASTDIQCDYKNGTGGTSAIKIDSTGVTAYCLASTHPPSDSAVFTTNPALGATAAAIVGVPLVLTVTRTKGTVSSATLGLDSLSVAETTTVGAQINPSTFSFNDNEPSPATRTSNIVFTKAGDASLQVNLPPGYTVPAPIKVIVSGSTASSCDGIPVPPYAVDAPRNDDATTNFTNMGDHRLIAASASERAAGAIRFTAPATGSPTFYMTTTDPGLSSLDMTVSVCPGDFSKVSSACKVPGTISKGVKITVGTSVSTTDCIVKAGSPYYVNVRSVTPGRDVGLHLSTTSP